MKVFLSSTAEDLTEYRKVADETILRLKMDSVLMERFGPLPGMPIEECERLARDSDLIVCIVAHRYGSVPEPEMGSFTEREVKAAHNAGKDIRVWIVQDDFLWRSKKEQDFLVDPSIISDKKRAEEIFEAVNALISFKTWLRETFVCESFTTTDDLAWKISLALKNSTNVEETRDIRSDAELRLAYE